MKLCVIDDGTNDDVANSFFFIFLFGKQYSIDQVSSLITYAVHMLYMYRLGMCAITTKFLCVAENIPKPCIYLYIMCTNVRSIGLTCYHTFSSLSDFTAKLFSFFFRYISAVQAKQHYVNPKPYYDLFHKKVHLSNLPAINHLITS